MADSGGRLKVARSLGWRWRAASCSLLAVAVLAATVEAAVPAASPVADGESPTAVSGSDAFFGMRVEAAARLSPGRGVPTSGSRLTQDSEEFWAWDYHKAAYYQVRATLVHAGPTSQIFVEQGHSVPGATIRQLAVLYEDVVYLRLRNLYGYDPDPGVDGDRAVTLLLLDIRDPLYYNVPPYTYISGYFDPTNEYPQAGLNQELPGRKSNEREMLYLDISPTDPRGSIIRQTMAHEFAHLIVWNHDNEEEGWLAEGLGELAVYLCGLGHPRKHLLAYLADPEVPLVVWSGEVRDYGKVYLFMLYLYEQVGEDDRAWLRDLVAGRGRGMPSLEAALPLERSMSQIYRDYGLALHLDEPTAGNGQFGFRSLDLDGELGANGFPAARTHEWTHYPIDSYGSEVGPWTVRTDRFTLGQGALQVEMTSSRESCFGAGWMPGYRLHRGAVQFADACSPAGRPVSWLFPSFGVGLDVAAIHTVVANASDEPLRFMLSAVPPAGVESRPLPLFLPLSPLR